MTSPIELWGGVECTVNRVDEVYRDQTKLTGHHDRILDLDRIAALGIRTLRYPVLWERVAPNGLQEADWSWTDARLSRLRALGITPIVTLCHHGSGPRHTSLVDPSFATGLAEFARAAAGRYPWVTHWTPVNEPLTTARFSALYGLWYPHAKDETSFTAALFNEMRATVLAMQAIREVNPEAQLVQTEDFAHIHATPLLQYQADHENERRWLSLDLLTGRVDNNGAIGSYRVRGIVTDEQLQFFRENPCPPDVVGLNYYLTSERLLDERVERYPRDFHGGNALHRYADVEAVRAVTEGLVGHLGALRAAWHRYQLPLAFTEVHLGCSREEQLRWVDEAWRALHQARTEGIDTRALTLWSMFGAVDWNTLVTRDTGFYEPGVFDVRGPAPRETALATLARSLVSNEPAQHPVLEEPGWWRREERLFYPPVPTLTPGDLRLHPKMVRGWRRTGRPLLITGAKGLLGQALARECAIRGIHTVLTSRAELDVADSDAVENFFDEVRPWGVVNAAGYVHVDKGEREPSRCHRENAIGPALLAAACARLDLELVTFSTDLVFDGRSRRAYVETDAMNPLSVYGRSKAAGERHVLRDHPRALVVRTSSLFGLPDHRDFAGWALAALQRGETLRVANDHVMAPTFVPDLCRVVMDLLIDGASGVWHLANTGQVSWADFARALAAAIRVPTSRVVGVPSQEVYEALRPRWSVLGTALGERMRPFEDALASYLDHWRAHRPKEQAA